MKALGFILAIAISPFSFASEVVISKGIELLAINGEKISGGLFSSDKVEADDGEHQIVVRYSNTFGKNELIQSKPYIFTIEVKGKTVLDTNNLNSKSHALSKIDSGLDWYIINTNGEYTVDNTAQLSGSGFMPYSDIEGLITEYNQTNHIITAETITNSDKAPSQINLIVEQYKAGTAEQRKQFKVWLMEFEKN